VSEDRNGTAGDDALDDESLSLPIEDSIDLHTFHPRDIPDVVREYLREAAAKGFGEVRIIHGKGTGFQREVVAKVLRDHPLVESFSPGTADRGHWGATIVKLRDVSARD